VLSVPGFSGSLFRIFSTESTVLGTLNQQLALTDSSRLTAPDERGFRSPDQEKHEEVRMIGIG
jgi:hypothetical protein